MSNNYRRLNSKDRKKLEMYKVSKKFLKKGIKWWLAISCIVCLFVVGLAAFYITIDNMEDKNLGKGKERLSSVNSKSINEEDDTVGLSELNKKELERESDKEKIISHLFSNLEEFEPCFPRQGPALRSTVGQSRFRRARHRCRGWQSPTGTGH